MEKIIMNRRANFIDIKGHEHAKRGLEVALSGDHDVILVGPPKSGKSLLRKAVEDTGFKINIYEMRPCPCGFFTDPKHECNCAPVEIKDYLSSLPAHIIDKTDIYIEVPRLNLEQLQEKRRGELSEDILERVQLARVFLHSRRADLTLDKEAEDLLKLAILELGISSRAYDKIMSVAGTIAGMGSKLTIEAHHISEAISYRSLDRNLWG